VRYAIGMRDDLLAWQWANYPAGHTDRKNLAIHIATTPLFLGGTVLAVVDLFIAPGYVLVGLAAMIVAVALQLRGHKLERNAPLPFAGPVDVVARLFVEQWVTFPRFVISGGFARAWRKGGAAR
jgi:uncharacterized membrane protein YGL010W